LSKDELLIVLERAIERSGLLRRNRELSAELARRIDVPDIVAGHGAMQAVLRLVAKVAPSTSTVLIRGETGTGKELVARAIHRASRKAEGPFLALNCSAIPPTLLESE